MGEYLIFMTKSVLDYPICQINQNPHAEAFRDAFRLKNIRNATVLANALSKTESTARMTRASATVVVSNLLNLKQPLNSRAGRALRLFLGLEALVINTPKISKLHKHTLTVRTATLRPSTAPNFLKQFYNGSIRPQIIEADETMTKTLIEAGVTSFENLVERALSCNPDDRRIAVVPDVLDRLQKRTRRGIFRDGTYIGQSLKSVLQIWRFQASVSTKSKTISETHRELPSSGISTWEAYGITEEPEPTYPRPPNCGRNLVNHGGPR